MVRRHLSGTMSEIKKDILANIKQALEAVKLHQEGKIVLPKARDILNKI
ncbi:MAG: hypothetical protein AB8B69_18595 [Chitinophagales bacterium]